MGRNEAYWTSLLDHVDNLDTEEMANGSAEAISAEEYATLFSELESAADNAWLEAEQAMRQDETFEVTVVGHNKGGLLVEWSGLAGFVPASQLQNLPKFHIQAERIAHLRKRIGDRITVKIIEVDQFNNRLVFSERAANVDSNARQDLWDSLQIGSSREGTITNMTDFGAFVDLGGVEGLIHISELSWSRLNHPSDVVSSGQSVVVKVISIDRLQGRVALSLKRMRQDPWKGIEQRYRVGQLVRGLVSNVVPFGAFVTLEDELEGLIHISELAEGSFLNPRYVVRKGQHVVAKVLSVNEKERRIALTLRGLDRQAQASAA